jgi:hypothetical protein
MELCHVEGISPIFILPPLPNKITYHLQNIKMYVLKYIWLTPILSRNKIKRNVNIFVYFISLIQE